MGQYFMSSPLIISAIKLYQQYGFKITSELQTTYNKQYVITNKMERPINSYSKIQQER